MAFLLARPISTTKPICVRMLLSRPRSQTPVSANRMHSGTIAMIANGNDQLSYWNVNSKNTNRTLSGKISRPAPPARRCWNASSDHSKLEARRQQSRGKGLHRRQRVAGADAGRRAALDLRSGIKVVAHDAVGAGSCCERRAPSRAAPWHPSCFARAAVRCPSDRAETARRPAPSRGSCGRRD